MVADDTRDQGPADRVRRAQRRRASSTSPAASSASPTGCSAAASPCMPRCPGPGGLFTGSEVTYRGVKVGKVCRDGRHPDRHPGRHGHSRTRRRSRWTRRCTCTTSRRWASSTSTSSPPTNKGPYAGRGRHHQGRRQQPADERGAAAHRDGRDGQLGRQGRALHGGRRAGQHVPRHGQPAPAHGRLRHRVRRRGGRQQGRPRSPCSTPAGRCCRHRPTTRRTSAPSPRTSPT